MNTKRLSFCGALALGTILWLSPAVSSAQADDDLLDDLAVPEQPQPETPAAEPEEIEAEEVAPAPAAAPAPAPAPQETAEEAELRAAAQDRIKAVPRKAVLKKGRLEIGGFASLSLNDAYWQHWVASGSAIYYPHDSFGIGIGADYLYAHDRTSNVDVVRQTQTAVPVDPEQPRLLAHLDLYWVPIYGKVSLFNAHIVHFELYGSTGLGVATRFGSQQPVAVNAAVGQRFFLSDWLAVRWEVRNHSFVVKQTAHGPRSDIQNYALFMLGAAFYIPPSFEYSYL